jgi:AraC-like DNA-binding protein
LSACSRLIDLLDTAEDLSILSNTIQRKIVYRLLRGPQGERLRAIATSGDQSHRTAKAIAWLRANFDKPLHVEELAEVARIGTSTFHHHFRALTAMSQPRYQKQLRLHAARDRMRIDGLDAASAAFLKLDIKAQANSVASTDACLANHQCGTSKRAGSPALQRFASDDRAADDCVRMVGHTA